LAKAKGKKVIVSMGPYAASGGYYVSAPADAIIADPLTITGSIGIFGGKLVLGDAVNYYTGANFDAVTAGSPTINLVTAARPFTNAEREAFKQMIDRGYTDFLNTVARGRKMPFEKVHDVAHGRVWTGAQAKARGLVDELGGLSTAIAKAKQLAGIEEKSSVTLKLFPKQKSPVEELRDMFGASAEGARAAVVLGAILGDERVNQALKATITRDREPLSARAPDMKVH
jgi:protease-4